MEPLLFENILANWLWGFAKDSLVRHRKENWPDFELKTQDGKRLLLEIKSKPPSESTIHFLTKKYEESSDPNSEFLLVTPNPPAAAEAARFRKAFGKQRARWLAIDELPKILGRPSPGPWDSPRTWAKVQNAALVAGLESYSGAPITPTPYVAAGTTGNLRELERQFSYATISKLSRVSKELEEQLGLGARRENVTIVLSDLVNFSAMVSASRPDDLKESMSDYYQKARNAVFEYGGTLDKFIGDAVLAVFGYPFQDPQSPVRAIQFANTLISIGTEVMTAWQAELNAVIPTGTRIGIATGDIWPINIGREAIEAALLGDTINLAARLEKSCVPDRFIIDNRTYTAAQRADSSYVSGLNLQQLLISTSDTKGQTFPVRAWTPQN